MRCSANSTLHRNELAQVEGCATVRGSELAQVEGCATVRGSELAQVEGCATLRAAVSIASNEYVYTSRMTEQIQEGTKIQYRK